MSLTPQENKDVLTLTPISAVKNPIPILVAEKSSAIAVSLPKSKVTTSKDKSRLCKKSSQKQKSSLISALDSTGREKGFFPYWNALSKERSSKLWLPTETAWPDSDTKSSVGFSKSGTANSWFSLKTLPNPQMSLSEKIFVPSFTSSLVGLTDEEATVKTKKIRIYPTSDQQILFKKWFGFSRWAFNRALNHCLKGEKWLSKFDLKILVLKEMPHYFKEAPYAIKGQAVIDFYAANIAAKKANKAVAKSNGIKTWNSVRHRLKNRSYQSCFIPSSAISEKGIYSSLSGPNLRFAEPLPKDFGDSRLILDNGRWFINLSVKVKNFFNPSENQGRVVALDPGVRTFMTFFSETYCGKIANKSFSRIQRLSHHLDKLLSKRKLETRKARLKHAIHKALNRIRDLVDELHWKTCRFLVDNFDVILLPTFETSQMISKRGRRKIRAKTARNMQTFAFYRFSQRLKQKAKEAGKVVLFVCEAYTSKTASWTGEIKQNLNGSKTITSQGVKVDRDINGARGIFLRALGDHPEILTKC
jgi:putative transposase